MNDDKENDNDDKVNGVDENGNEDDEDNAYIDKNFQNNPFQAIWRITYNKFKLIKESQ